MALEDSSASGEGLAAGVATSDTASLEVSSCACRLECAAAVKIQALWRGFFFDSYYQIDLMDIITIQCYARMVLAKKECVSRYNAVQVLRRSARVVPLPEARGQLYFNEFARPSKCQ
jgi:hypothetical protein